MWLVICAWNHGKYILKCCDWIVFMWVYSPCLKQNQTLRSKRNRKNRPRMRRAQKSPRTPGNDDSGGVFFLLELLVSFTCVFLVVWGFPISVFLLSTLLVAKFFLVYTHSTSAGLRKFWTCCRTSWKRSARRRRSEGKMARNKSTEAEDWVGKNKHCGVWRGKHAHSYCSINTCMVCFLEQRFWFGMAFTCCQLNEGLLF